MSEQKKGKQIASLEARNELLEQELEKTSDKLKASLVQKELLERQLEASQVKWMDSKVEYGLLEAKLEARNNLYSVENTRYLLELLEDMGRPENLDFGEWNYKTTREMKWNKIFQIPDADLHPVLKRFLLCVSLDVVKLVFDACDSKIHYYFQDIDIKNHVFCDERVKCAVECLKSLEEDIISTREKV